LGFGDVKQTLLRKVLLPSSQTLNSTSMTANQDGRFQAVYEKMKIFFNNASLFDDLLSVKLRLAFSKFADTEMMTEKEAKNLAVKYYTETERSTLDEERIKKINKVFLILWVYIVSERSETQSLFFETVDKLKTAYPAIEIAGDDPSLLPFRNMLKASLCVLEGRRNKQTIFDIAFCLSGTKKRSFGSGQKAPMDNREKIYEKEGKVEQEDRSGRDPREPKQQKVVLTAQSGDVTPQNHPPRSPPNKRKRSLETAFAGSKQTKKSKQQCKNSFGNCIQPVNLERAGVFLPVEVIPPKPSPVLNEEICVFLQETSSALAGVFSEETHPEVADALLTEFAALLQESPFECTDVILEETLTDADALLQETHAEGPGVPACPEDLDWIDDDLLDSMSDPDFPHVWP